MGSGTKGSMKKKAVKSASPEINIPNGWSEIQGGRVPLDAGTSSMQAVPAVRQSVPR
jgi:hypothetical protein